MTKVSWRVPRWSYLPKLRRELRDFRRTTSFTRIGVASVLGMVLVFACVILAYPDLGLARLWRVPTAVVGICGLMGFNLVVLPTLFPPHVTVTPEKIHVWSGETGWIARREECSNFVLITFSPDRHRLRFRHNGRHLSIGVAESVDPCELCSLLAPSKGIDAQPRFVYFQKRKIEGLSPGG